MTLDITQAKFATTIDTFKNIRPSKTGSISVPSESYTAGQYRAFSTTITLDETDAVTQVLQNFSFDSSKYWAGTFVQAEAGSSFLAQTRMTMSGTTLSVDLYVINNTGGVQSNSAFTLDIQARQFLAPFN
jgi:hypothetical protein